MLETQTHTQIKMPTLSLIFFYWRNKTVSLCFDRQSLTGHGFCKQKYIFMFLRKEARCGSRFFWQEFCEEIWSHLGKKSLHCSSHLHNKNAFLVKLSKDFAQAGLGTWTENKKDQITTINWENGLSPFASIAILVANCAHLLKKGFGSMYFSKYIKQNKTTKFGSQRSHAAFTPLETATSVNKNIQSKLHGLDEIQPEDTTYKH